MGEGGGMGMGRVRPSSLNTEESLGEREQGGRLQRNRVNQYGQLGALQNAQGKGKGRGVNVGVLGGARRNTEV